MKYHNTKHGTAPYKPSKYATSSETFHMSKGQKNVSKAAGRPGGVKAKPYVAKSPTSMWPNKSTGQAR